jgi:hypothetical protein
MRTRSRPRARSASSEEDFDLGRIGVNRMMEYLVEVGALPATDPSGSGVLPQQPVDPGSQVSVATIEALFQRRSASRQHLSRNQRLSQRLLQLRPLYRRQQGSPHLNSLILPCLREILSS